MKDAKKTPLWCPQGRVSIQKFDGGVFKDAVPGGYNMINLTDLRAGIAPSMKLIPATPCLKQQCALYRPSVFLGRHGRCGLEKPNPGAWIFAAVIIAEILAIAATAIFYRL